jgi:protein-S-isoprenylcysteine O-methyltransferase Ste14
VISKCALAILVLGIAFLALNNSLFSASLLVTIAQLLAVALSLWARASFGPGKFRVTAEPGEGTLLRRGPYRVIRHPMYAAALLFVWASILGHLTAFNLSTGLVITLAVGVRIGHEEQLLIAGYPEYPQYSSITKRIVPYLF